MILHGLEAALSFPAPGSGHNKVVPPVVYGQDASYDLPAPLLYTPAKAFGHNSHQLGYCWPESLAVRRMLRTVRSSLVSDSSGKVNSYFHGGSHGVRSALYNYLMTLSQSRPYRSRPGSTSTPRKQDGAITG